MNEKKFITQLIRVKFKNGFQFQGITHVRINCTLMISKLIK